MNNQGAIFMPPAASTFAHQVDSAYMIINYICVFFFFLVIGLMTYFVIKYRRRSENDLTPNIAHNTPLEITWTIIPLIFVTVIFFIGFKGYMNERVVPQNAMQVYVTGQRWFWTFEYPSGTKQGLLAVPAGRPVQLIMNSQDVLHAFFVPDFRVKQDLVPNRYTTLWFQADEPGTHTLFCAEYCGKGHSEMMSKVLVMRPEDFKLWDESGGIDKEQYDKLPLPERGKLLYNLKCNACHTVDGSVNTGPTWKGIFGHPVKFTDGSSVNVDENYIRESIVHPQAKIVLGYSPIMPTFQGQLDDQQINAVIEYIKSLK